MNDIHRIQELEERIEQLEDKFEAVTGSMLDMIGRLNAELIHEKTKVSSPISSRDRGGGDA